MRYAPWIAAAAAALAIGASPALRAEDKTVVGPVTHIELAADGKGAVATLKDNATGEEVRITVSDDLTLDKFKDKRIGEGDEVRARFDKADPAATAKSFKKVAGC
jgi:hypothetical protein